MSSAAESASVESLPGRPHRLPLSVPLLSDSPIYDTPASAEWEPPSPLPAPSKKPEVSGYTIRRHIDRTPDLPFVLTHDPETHDPRPIFQPPAFMSGYFPSSSPPRPRSILPRTENPLLRSEDTQSRDLLPNVLSARRAEETRERREGSSLATVTASLSSAMSNVAPLDCLPLPVAAAADGLRADRQPRFADPRQSPRATSLPVETGVDTSPDGRELSPHSIASDEAAIESDSEQPIQWRDHSQSTFAPHEVVESTPDYGLLPEHSLERPSSLQGKAAEDNVSPTSPSRIASPSLPSAKAPSQKRKRKKEDAGAPKNVGQQPRETKSRKIKATGETDTTNRKAAAASKKKKTAATPKTTDPKTRARQAPGSASNGSRAVPGRRRAPAPPPNSSITRYTRRRPDPAGFPALLEEQKIRY